MRSPSGTRKVLRKSSETIQKALSSFVYEFGPFRLDTAERQLLRDGKAVPLTPKVYEVLQLLVQNSGHMLEKDELLKAVWPDSFVEEGNLTRNISTLRAALGENSDEHQYIETVPKRGYRFIANVREFQDESAQLMLAGRTRAHIIIEEEEASGHGDEGTRRRGDVIAAPPTQSKVGFLSAAIKQHRWRATLGVLTLAVAAAAIVYFTRPGEAIDSVAVMPFVNMSGDPNTEYLSDGLSDSIIDSLSQLPSLKTVIARSSVSRYKGEQTDPQEIGRQLNVRAVLMGQVIKRGDDLSISVELVDVRDNKHLWGAQYNRRLADIISVQTDIAQEISERLRLRLSGEEKKRLAKRYTDSVETYQLYLMGRYYSNRWTKEGLEKSIEFYEQAIKKDPNYAPPYAELAFTMALLESWVCRPQKRPSKNRSGQRLRLWRLITTSPKLTAQWHL